MIPAEILAVIDVLPDFVVMIEPDGSIVAVNQYFARALGATPDALVGRKIADWIETPPEKASRYLRLCAGSRQPLPGALTFRRHDGQRLDCRCDGAALRPSDNMATPVVLLRCREKHETLSHFPLLSRKIGELTKEILNRRRAEAALRRVNDNLQRRAQVRTSQITDTDQRLHESEERFRILVQGVTDYALYMLDPTGTVVSWNAGAERIKGYGADEIVGQHFSRFYTEDDRAAGVPRRALETARRVGKYEAEGWRVRKSGVRFWASVVIDAIRDDTGTLIQFAKITRDLTEKRAIEEQLRQSQKMEAVGQLTGGIAHDFNNLLTVISGNIETLERHLPADDRTIQRSLKGAMRGVDRAVVLTHRLLAFSRRQPLAPTPLDPNRLIIGMSDLLSRTIGENVHIETVLSGGLWQISADANQVENAILNLAVNARDAMQGGGKLTIETANVHLDEAYAAAHEEVAPGQYVMLAVTDTGAGIDKDILGKVFEPFFTTKKLGEGTGLGLSQVYGFIKQSGGHIKIYSEADEGTTVRLYLPRIESVLQPAGDRHIPMTPIQSSMEGETILVVEDDPDVRAHSTSILRELGYEVLEAPEGDTALSLLATEPRISLLFTDVGLPGAFNGRQLADEAIKRRPKLEVLFTTGYARNAIVHQGRLDPGVELIVKPFTYAGLAAKIRYMLDKEGITRPPITPRNGTMDVHSGVA